MKPFTMSLLFAASSYSFPQGYGGPSAQPVGQDQLGIDGATASLEDGCRLEWQTIHSIEEVEEEMQRCSPYYK